MDDKPNSIEDNDGLLRLDVVDAIRLRGAKDRARAILAAGGRAAFVNGRKAALSTLDFLMSQESSIQTLYHGLRERLEADPVGFYQDVILPSTGRNYKEAHDVSDADIDGMEGQRTVEAEAAETRRVVIRLPDNGRSGDRSDSDV